MMTWKSKIILGIILIFFGSFPAIVLSPFAFFENIFLGKSILPFFAIGLLLRLLIIVGLFLLLQAFFQNTNQPQAGSVESRGPANRALKNIMIALLAIVISILLFIGYSGGYFNQIFQSSSGHLAIKIDSFPSGDYMGINLGKDTNPSPYYETYRINNYEMRRQAYNKIDFVDMSTGEDHKVVATDKGSVSAALGDGFGVWVLESFLKTYNQEEAAYDENPEFDVWMYDFKTKREYLILKNLDNNLNPNIPPIAVSGRKAAVSTLANKITIIDIDIKTNENIDMLSGYTANNHSIHYLGNTIIVPAYENGTYNSDTLIGYDVLKKDFAKLYKSSRYIITDVRSYPDGYIYWREFAEWKPIRFYKMRID